MKDEVATAVVTRDKDGVTAAAVVGVSRRPTMVTSETAHNIVSPCRAALVVGIFFWGGIREVTISYLIIF
jgi:hypothetical protein